MKTHFTACFFACVSQAYVLSATVSAPSTEWTPLAGNFDYLADQQTGIPESDIVGQGTDYGFLVTYNPAGSGGSPVATFGFRLRLDAAGGPPHTPAYTRAAWLGIDAELNGSIDVFLGVNMAGNSNVIGIYTPGTGANNSPSSTSIISTPDRSYTPDASNYNYRPVDYLTDGGTTNDLTPGGRDDIDYYLSVLVPFADIVSYLAGRNIHITETSPLRYVTATATQANTLNQDLGGVNGGVGSNITWDQLGAFSPVISATGSPIPEPNTGLLGMLGLTVLLWRSRVTP